MTPEIRRARTAFWWVGVIVPLALLVLASIVVLSWLPDVPDPAAIHWGLDGADGFGPRWAPLALLMGVGGGTVILFAFIALFSHRLPQRGAAAPVPQAQWSATARLLGAVNLGTAGMMSLLAIASTAAQRGSRTRRMPPTSPHGCPSSSSSWRDSVPRDGSCSRRCPSRPSRRAQPPPRFRWPITSARCGSRL